MVDNLELWEAVVLDPEAALPGLGWKPCAKGWTATTGETPCCKSQTTGHLYLYSDFPYAVKCHKCNKATALTTALKNEGLDYGPALDELRQRLGLPVRILSDGERLRAEEASFRAELLESYLVLCQRSLPGCTIAQRFLEGRGWTLEGAQEVGLGVVPPYGKVKAWSEESGFSVDDLKKVNLWDRDGRLEGRVVIPCRGRSGGRLEGLSLRTVDGKEPRYYQAGSKANGAGLWAARGKGNSVLIVEGDFDAAAVKVRLPDTPVIALSGRTLSQETIAVAARLGLRDFFLALDLDREGQVAVDEAVRMVYQVMRANATLDASNLGVYVINPENVSPFGKDADEWTRTPEGKTALRQSIREAKSGWRWLMETSFLPCWQAVQTDWDRGQVIREVKSFGAQLPSPVALEFLSCWRDKTGELSVSVVDAAAETERRAQEQESSHRLIQQVETDLRKLRQEGGKAEEMLAFLRQAAGKMENVVVSSARPVSLSLTGTLDAASGLGEGRYCGWEKLEKIGWRLRPSELSLVGARPGCGKTTFLSNLVINVLRDPGAGPILLVQAELAIWQAHAFLLAPFAAMKRYGRWSTGEIVKQFCQGKLETDLEGVAEEFERMVAGRLFVSTDPLSPTQMARQGETIERQYGHPLTLVGIDYVELLQVEGRFDSPEQRVSAIADGLLSLAKKGRVAVVALCQFNRGATEGRGGGVENLRYSDRLGALATNLFSLALPEDKGEPEVDLQVTAEKNRYGEKDAKESLVWDRPVGFICDDFPEEPW